MTKSFTGSPERYESPEIEMFCFKAEHILCQSNTAPAGYDWEDWNNA